MDWLADVQPVARPHSPWENARADLCWVNGRKTEKPLPVGQGVIVAVGEKPPPKVRSLSPPPQLSGGRWTRPAGDKFPNIHWTLLNMEP